MKTGDASAEFWLQGLRHLYCCEVASERKTPESKRVRYFWSVEMVEYSLVGEGSSIHKTKWKACRTYADGLRLSRRMAEYLERKRMELDRGKK